MHRQSIGSKCMIELSSPLEIPSPCKAYHIQIYSHNRTFTEADSTQVEVSDLLMYAALYLIKCMMSA